MAIPDLGLLWQLVRRFEDLFEKVENATRGIAKARDDLADLERRITALESREELLVEKTRSAAAVAASNRRS
jgi:BMFP domain-containing protein YqiC